MIQVGSKIAVHPEALRIHAVRVDRGAGEVIKIRPGVSYGKWPAFLVVRWESGETTDIHVKHVYEITPVCEIDISRCEGLKSLSLPRQQGGNHDH